MKEALSNVGNVQHQDTITSAVKKTTFGKDGETILHLKRMKSGDLQAVTNAIQGTFPNAAISGRNVTLTGPEAIRFAKGYAYQTAPESDPGTISYVEVAKGERLNKAQGGNDFHLFT